MSPPGPPATPSPGGAGVAASAAVVTVGNVVSRASGFVRVMAVGAALGTTYVGNTYQSANLVSNVLFELLAAGLLSSVLVPPLVRRLDQGDRAGAERLAGAALGVALGLLGLVAVAGLVGRTLVMEILTIAVDDADVRRREIALGSYLLVFFLPQILLYAVGAVATALLHSARRFGAAAFAPVANNLVVVATMVAFWVVVGGGRPGLDLSASQRLLLGAGTTAGVAAMAAVPVLALRRAGLALRPRWEPRHPDLGPVVRGGLWAAGGLALTQVLTATTLVLANRVEGGVVAAQLAFQMFLLPFALLAHPVLTALFPHLAAARDEGPPSTFAGLARGGASVLLFLVLLASALLVALAEPALRLLELGALDAAGVALAGRVLAAYGLGLAGYAGLHYLTRVAYAAGDTRTPTLVMAGVAVGGSLLMVGWFAAASGTDRVVAIGLAHSVATVAGAAILAVVLRGRVGAALIAARSAGAGLVAATAAGLAGWGVASLVGGGGRLADAAAVAAGGLSTAAVYLAGQRLAGAPEVRGPWRGWRDLPSRLVRGFPASDQR